MLAETRSGKKAGQLQSELNGMIAEFSGAMSYLEIGARYGDTFFDVVRSMPEGSLAVCVDKPGDVWGNQGTESHLRDACRELGGMGYDIRLIVGDSRDKTIIQAVSELGPFDACLIDGDHRYRGVKSDWEAYSPMCNWVAFHDIVGHGQRCAPGIYIDVPKLWNEIKQEGDIEIIAEGSKMGIGITRGRRDG